MSEESIEERLTRIESSLAQVERCYDQLNQVVIAQGELLRRLQGSHSSIAASMENIELERIKGTNPKPPHYQ